MGMGGNWHYRAERGANRNVKIYSRSSPNLRVQAGSETGAVSSGQIKAEQGGTEYNRFRFLLGSPTLVGCLKFYCRTFFILYFLFLRDLRSARRFSGRTSNVYQRFGHMHHYSKVPRNLSHSSPNFYRSGRSKSATFVLIAQQRSTL